MGARITGKRRLAVIRLYGTICYLCGIKCRIYKGQNTGSQQPDALTIDHVVPQSLGGSDDISNLAVACATCNNLKDDLPPGNEEALEWMRWSIWYGWQYRTM